MSGFGDKARFVPAKPLGRQTSGVSGSLAGTLQIQKKRHNSITGVLGGPVRGQNHWRMFDNSGEFPDSWAATKSQSAAPHLALQNHPRFLLVLLYTGLLGLAAWANNIHQVVHPGPSVNGSPMKPRRALALDSLRLWQRK